MPCIHGLEDNHCPICRISNSTLPINRINKNLMKKNELDSFNHLFKNKISGNMDFEEDVSLTTSNLRPNLINDFPKPTFINSIPNFENKLFLERIDSLSIEKSNNLGLTRKISLEKPELNLEEE